MTCVSYNDKPIFMADTQTPDSAVCAITPACMDKSNVQLFLSLQDFTM